MESCRNGTRGENKGKGKVQGGRLEIGRHRNSKRKGESLALETGESFKKRRRGASLKIVGMAIRGVTTKGVMNAVGGN